MKQYYLLFLIVLIVNSFNNIRGQSGVVNVGEDWSIPISVQPASNSGFFSEELDSATNVNLQVFDITWAQINPSKNQFSYTSTGQVTTLGLTFPSFNNQNATTKAFWMRIWNSGTTWAPSWIQTECSVSSVGTDDDGQAHLPIWNSCVWSNIKAMYKHIFQDLNMRADPRLKFIYVPGAFNWCEFDFTIIGGYANQNTSYTFSIFNSWFTQAMQDLVDIFGPYSYKLVYTGEDFPFDVPDNWYPAAAYTARDAVAKGMGVRTGITELSNFHLSEIPAYGITIDSNGYMNLNKTWPLQTNPNRIIATENECYTACGFTVSNANLFYAIKMSNLKALQMGVNWLYVVPQDSYLTTYSDHWNWVRLNIGRLPSNAIEGWVSLREAQDTYWSSPPNFPLQWTNKPYVKNYERFIYQRDLPNGQSTKKGSTKYTGILTTENGIAFEGRSTDLASNNNTFAFLVDDDFINGIVNVSLKITFLDKLSSSFTLVYYDGISNTVKTSNPVLVGATNSLRTATFSIQNIKFQNQFANSVDFKVVNNGNNDIELLFVRIIKLSGVNNPSISTTTNNNNKNSSDSASNSNSIYQNNNYLLILILIITLMILSLN